MACFPRRARLTKPEEFKRVFDNGRRHSDALLTAVVAAASAPQNHARIGLAIAKKAVALSSARNHIKRQVRESFREHQARLPAVDIVILSRPGTATASGEQLRLALSRLWKRIAESCAA